MEEQIVTSPNIIKPRLLKIKAAAAYLAVSTWKLRNLVQAGAIQYIPGAGTSPWRFDLQDLDEYIDRNRQRF
jgi:excisionase family DNA binding protein